MKSLLIENKNRSRKEILIWWELRRILYNLIMIIVGIISFQIAYISIPLIYSIIGLSLNILYTSGWLIEIFYIRNTSNEDLKHSFAIRYFIGFILFSIIVVFGIAFILVI